MGWNVLFRRKPKLDVDCLPAESDNLYRMWVTCPRQVVLSRLPRLAFTPTEIDAAATWSAKQKSCGLRADIADDAFGYTTVLEVFGPDDMVPHCIMYPSHTGIQVDEFTGNSRIYPCLEAALREVAPLH